VVNLTSWHVVVPGDDPDEVVVAVDFPVTGRPEAGFADLAGQLRQQGSRRGFWQTVPPPVVPGSGVSGTDYVDTWASELIGSGVAVRGVLGFCVGSVYASVLADKVAAATGTAPELVLFDPEPATVTTLYWQFEKMIGNLAGVLTDEEAASVRQQADTLANADAADVTGFAVQLYAMFRPVAVAAFERLGLDCERTEEVLGLFASFISYLSVAAQLDPAAGWKAATALSSATQASGLNPARSAAGEDSDLVAREVRFDVPHAELLRSADVAGRAARVLGG
jgi:hypothetical protein